MKINEEMLNAITAYRGEVVRCPPGEAMADPVKLKPAKINTALPLRTKPPPINVVVERADHEGRQGGAVAGTAR